MEIDSHENQLQQICFKFLQCCDSSMFDEAFKCCVDKEKKSNTKPIISQEELESAYKNTISNTYWGFATIEKFSISSQSPDHIGCKMMATYRQMQGNKRAKEMYMYQFPLYHHYIPLSILFSTSSSKIFHFEIYEQPQSVQQWKGLVIRHFPPFKIETKLVYHKVPQSGCTFYFPKPPTYSKQRDITLRCYCIATSKQSTAEQPQYLQAEPSGTVEGSTQLLKVTIPPSKEEIDFVLETSWTSYPRYLDLLQSNETTQSVYQSSGFVPQLSSEERELFLKCEPQKYNWKQPTFIEWMVQNNLFRDKTKETDVQFAYRALGVIHRRIFYSADPKYRGCGMGGVARGCLDGQTDWYISGKFDCIFIP